ncbi:MAG: protein-L-isoaspartate O-methyltransferase [Gammaproteobacteria bacterium]|nr:protein-L-isoaspartate O-methyltransferase [Gammaproteobacteria bacterium]
MIEMNFDEARFNMIEQQIRPWNVLDQRVLDLLNEVPREDFVPAQYRNMALTDMELPIGFDQLMMTPRVEARMLQALDVQSNENVLEVGTGSGYVTALLARLAKKVYSVEIIPDLLAAAATRLAEHDTKKNISLEEGDAAKGWPLDAPYNVIALTGSTPILPDTFKNALTIGGRLFAVVGDSPNMEALLITRVGEFDWMTESLFELDLAPLKNAAEPDRFVL